jgi:hypothetical protein
VIEEVVDRVLEGAGQQLPGNSCRARSTGKRRGLVSIYL